MTDMTNPNEDLGIMLAIAIGDGYGAGFEYAPPKLVEAHNDLSGYVQHQKWKTLKPGSYTDDTQMAMGVAEHMLDALDSGAWASAWNPLALAERFVDGFHRDQRTGYSGAFYKFLLETKNGYAFLANIRPQSAKSGGAMRAAPLGLHAATEQVRDLAMFQASLTHATKGGMDAAAAAALMTHYCYHDIGKLAQLPAWLDMMVPGWEFCTSWRGKVGSAGMDSVKAALTALTWPKKGGLSDVLQQCIAWTGDVDTVAAIAMPAAAMSREVTNDLPMVLYDDLENDDYGYDYLIDLDRRLREKFLTQTEYKAKLAKEKAAKKRKRKKREKPEKPKGKPLIEVLADDDDEGGPLDFLFRD